MSESIKNASSTNRNTVVTEVTARITTTISDGKKEALLPDDTTLNNLLKFLSSKPEVLVAAEDEAEEKKEEAKEEELRKIYGDDYEMVFGQKSAPVKSKRRPGATQLRENFKVIAKTDIGMGGKCEVFNNGYSIYDNGDRKTVLWVADCGSTTYYFGKLNDNEKQYLHETDVVGEDVLGDCPWYIALTLAGENAIERNQDHPKSLGTSSDSDKEDYEVEKSFRWIGGTHFDTPEEAYLKKEAAEERRKALTEKQRETYEMYYEEGLNQYEIAEKLGISQKAVQFRLDGALKKIKKFF